MTETRRSGWRTGCWAALCVGGLVLLLAGIGFWVVSRQVHSERPGLQVRELRPEAGLTSEDPRFVAAPRPAGRIELEVQVIQLIVVPVAAGRPLRCEAYFDESRYTLTEARQDHDDGSWTYRISMVPSSMAMAILRSKIGGDIARLRLEIPRDLGFDLDVDVRSGFATMELGGLGVRDIRIDVHAGAANLHFMEPLPEPMGRLVAIGNAGSIEISALGNASPSTVLLQQHVGELDVDLRGAWVRPSEVSVRVGAAAGSLWLPEGARVTGFDRARPFRLPPAPGETPPVPIDIEIVERGGRMLLVE